MLPFINVTFVFNINFTPKIIYSYWFMIIFFFSFILIKILNISKYCIFNFLNLFFYSKNISFIFNYSVILFSLSLKRFLIYVIMFSSSRLKLFIIIYYENYFFLKKQKSVILLKKNSKVLFLR